jgi:hypothetical protein
MYKAFLPNGGNMKTAMKNTALAICVLALALPALGQTTAPSDNGGGPSGATTGGGGGGNGGGGQRMRNPQQFMQRIMDNLKQQLGSTDDEFAALQPKIEKVIQLRRDTAGNPMRMFGRRGGGGGGGGFMANNATPSPTQQATEDLQATLDDTSATAAAIKGKLDALREAKSKAKEDLAAAQTDLKSVLTQRQEAVLVMDGLLD